MATTTVAVIIAAQRALVVACSPASAVLTDVGFEHVAKRHRLSTWLEANGGGTASLRKFEIAREGARKDHDLLFPDQALVQRELVLSVAYPTAPDLYGTDEAFSLEDVAEADAAELRNVLIDPVNITTSGHLATWVTVDGLDRDNPDVWVMKLKLTVEYYEVQ